MALVKCPDCGRDISDQAPACIGCGRPLAAFASPPEVCEVVLRRISEGGVFSDPLWVLEGQVMTAKGITVAASVRYKSKNALAEYQGEYRAFQEARQELTGQLLRQGWEPLSSTSAGAAISLPRFRRRPGSGSASAGENGTGFILTRVS